MRDMVAVCAILGGIIEAIAAVGGPQLAGVGMLTNEPAPAMPTGPLIVGLAAAVIAVLGGALVSMGRNAQAWGLLLIGSTVVGIQVAGPLTGWFTIGAGPTLLAGVLALFIRHQRGEAG